jgi:hypothetical protein
MMGGSARFDIRICPVPSSETFSQTFPFEGSVVCRDRCKNESSQCPFGSDGKLGLHEWPPRDSPRKVQIRFGDIEPPTGWSAMSSGCLIWTPTLLTCRGYCEGKYIIL